MDQLKAMRALVRVIDEKSFAGAARALGVAPAQVTRAVAELEAHLGARLVTRTTRSLALTDIGSRYLERARAILADVAEAAALAGAAQAEPRGHVRVRAAASFAARQLGPRLARFRELHPEVSVEVTATGAVEAIDEAHDITLIVRRDPLDGGFVARRLARSELVLCATPGYLDHAGRPAQPDALAGHTVLAPEPRAQRRPLVLVHAASGAGATVTPQAPGMSSENHEVNHGCALAGLGIAALPSYTAQDDLRAGRLERVLPGWRLFDLTIWGCVPTRKHLPASTRALLDFLVDELGGRDHDPWHENHEDAPAPAFQLKRGRAPVPRQTRPAASTMAA